MEGCWSVMMRFLRFGWGRSYSLNVAFHAVDKGRESLRQIQIRSAVECTLCWQGQSFGLEGQRLRKPCLQQTQNADIGTGLAAMGVDIARGWELLYFCLKRAVRCSRSPWRLVFYDWYHSIGVAAPRSRVAIDKWQTLRGPCPISVKTRMNRIVAAVLVDA